MTKRLIVRDRGHQSLPRVSRSCARGGWRVFRSTRDGYEIAVPEYQVVRVERLARQDRNEWHGLAVGELHEDEHGAHAIVRDFVPNDWAECGPAHVHISAMAESHVRELATRLHPTLVRIGIIHTHPGYTTRPSATDREEFWRDERAVSIIVDPTDSPTIAVYRGADGEKLVEDTTPLSEEKAPAVTTEAQPLAVLSSVPAQPPRRLGAKTKSTIMGLAVVVSATALLLSLAVRSDARRTKSDLWELQSNFATLESRLKIELRPTSCPPVTITPDVVPDGPDAICLDNSNSR